jgi:hypothetical protein
MGKNQRMPAKGINCQNKFDLGCCLSPGGVDWMKGVCENKNCSETNGAVFFLGGQPFRYSNGMVRIVGLFTYRRIKGSCLLGKLVIY